MPGPLAAGGVCSTRFELTCQPAMSATFSLPSDHRLIGTRRWGRVEGITLEPLGATEGRREFLQFRPGFYASLGDVTHRSDRRDVYASGDFIKLHFRLAGDSRVSQVHAHRAEQVGAMTVSTLVQPHDSFKEEIFLAGVRERSLTLCCNRRFLIDEFGLDLHAGGPIADYLHGRHQGFALCHQPLQPEQQAAAAALLDSNPDDPLRALLAEAKAFSLLHSFLLTQAPGSQRKDDAQTPQQRRYAQVQAYVVSHLAAPLSMRELAQQFGMSESRLSRGFREVFGMPLFQYVTELRLKKGMELLRAGEASVTEVAYSVGYNHVANFSTAFKRAFGVSPHAVRRQRSPAPQASPARSVAQ